MIGERLRASVAGLELRLASLRAEVERERQGAMPELDRAIEDLGTSLEELHVVLEELETTNEELTQAKRDAERETRRYEELFRLLPAAYFVTDERGVIQEANQAASDLFGHRPAHLIGKPLSEFVTGRDSARYFELLDGLEAGHIMREPEVELCCRAGLDRRFVAGVSVTPSYREDASVEGARWIFRDLTLRIRQEREERERRDRAAYRYVAGGVIHHLNSLLGSIRGYTELLMGSQAIEAREQRAARQIQAGTERGERLTSQLLAFARAGEGGGDIRSVNEPVREACEMAQGMFPEGTRVVTDLSPDAGPVRVAVLDLYQAVLNLIFNSRDALDEGGGEIHVGTHLIEVDPEMAEQLEIEPGPHVVIRVADTGGGMDVEAQGRAVEPFFTTKPSGKGFGLGLSTADAIIREAGGALDLESELGSGTEVRLYLPCA